MDVKDLIELAKDPAKYEAILKNIEDQRAFLQEDITAYGGAQKIAEARAKISKQLEDAEVEADRVVREAHLQANSIVDEAKRQAEKLTQDKADLGLREDKLLAKEQELNSRENILRQEEDAVKRAYAAAKKEVDEVAARNKALEEALNKIRNIV